MLCEMEVAVLSKAATKLSSLTKDECGHDWDAMSTASTRAGESNAGTACSSLESLPEMPEMPAMPEMPEMEAGGEAQELTDRPVSVSPSFRSLSPDLSEAARGAYGVVADAALNPLPTPPTRARAPRRLPMRAKVTPQTAIVEEPDSPRYAFMLVSDGEGGVQMIGGKRCESPHLTVRLRRRLPHDFMMNSDDTSTFNPQTPIMDEEPDSPRYAFMCVSDGEGGVQMVGGKRCESPHPRLRPRRLLPRARMMDNDDGRTFNRIGAGLNGNSFGTTFMEGTERSFGESRMSALLARDEF